MKETLTKQEWLKLPLGTRQAAAAEFGLIRTSGNHMENNTLLSDGYECDQIYKVNVTTLQDFTGSKETDIFKLVKIAFDGIEPFKYIPSPPKDEPTAGPKKEPGKKSSSEGAGGKSTGGGKQGADKNAQKDLPKIAPYAPKGGKS